MPADPPPSTTPPGTTFATFATIDIGTNTTLLLVARTEPGREAQVLDERAEITRLGRGIGHGGALGAQAIARTLDVLRAYAELARAHGARVAAVGTEALRRAPNAADFLEPAAAILGIPVEVIDGAREAGLTFQAVIASFPARAAGGTLVVVDIGGGSTEIIVSERGFVRFRTSLPLGSVRLTERHVRHDPPTFDELAALESEIDAALDAIPFPASDGGPTAAGAPAGAGAVTVVGVAGTVTSLAAMALALRSYDPTRVHGYALPRAALEAQVSRLAASTQAEREQVVGLDPRRADVILAGALLLLHVARTAGVQEILVSDRGIRWGLLHELAAASAPGAEGPPRGSGEGSGQWGATGGS